MLKTSFIIYEKSYLIRKGLVTIIDKIANSKILLEVEHEDEALEALIDCESDFFIFNSEVLVHKELLKTIKENSTSTQFIALSDNNSKPFREHFIAETIYLNDSQSDILRKLNLLIGNKESKKLKKEIPEEISKREADILKYIALGYSNKEIADKLFLSTHTVTTHRKNITRKLGIKTVPGLTIYAILNKLIDINDTE